MDINQNVFFFMTFLSLFDLTILDASAEI